MSSKGGKVGSYLRKNWSRFVIGALMWLASLLVLIPLAMVVMGSLKSPLEAMMFDLSIPTQWHPENYVEVFRKGRLLNAVKNSLSVLLLSIPITVVVSAMCAYYLGRVHSRLTRNLYSILTVGVYLPVSIIPTLLLLQHLKLNGTLIGISLIYIGLRCSWSVFLLTGFVRTVPTELDEAARVDGCGPLKTFWQIIFPLMRPVVITNVTIITMWNWNDFHLPVYFLSSSEKMTLPMTVYYFFGQNGSSWNLIFANLILTALPIVIMYFFGQKYIVSGMMAGAVKG